MNAWLSRDQLSDILLFLMLHLTCKSKQNKYVGSCGLTFWPSYRPSSIERWGKCCRLVYNGLCYVRKMSVKNEIYSLYAFYLVISTYPWWQSQTIRLQNSICQLKKK